SCFAVACSGKDSGEIDDFTKSTKSIYTVYADYVAEKGETPLTYEEWLESIRGEKGDKGDAGEKGDKGDAGVGIINAYFNDKLELILVLDNGEINCGAVTTQLKKTTNNFIIKISRSQKIVKELADKIYEKIDKIDLGADDTLELMIEKRNVINEYFALKNEIEEIYKALADDEHFDEISQVMTAYQDLENTFITGLFQHIREFYEENTKKSEILTQKISILLLLMM
ncbi:MAG: hypothetical protein J6U92_01910, partial [Clostridia bacterium]|nr:hypothetical protein [Clostridia bacterium]